MLMINNPDDIKLWSCIKISEQKVRDSNYLQVLRIYHDNMEQVTSQSASVSF